METAEALTPSERVKGLKFYINTHEFIEIADGEVKWFHEQKYGILGRMPIDKARKSVAALCAALAAYDDKPLGEEVRVVNWELERKAKHAEEVLAELNEAVDRFKARGR